MADRLRPHAENQLRVGPRSLGVRRFRDHGRCRHSRRFRAGRNDEGGKPIRGEYFSEDIAATVYTKLGIPHDLIVRALDGRPIRLNEGRQIKEWV